MSKPVILLDAGQLISFVGSADGDVLTWDGTAGEWVSEAGGGGGSGTVTSVTSSTTLSGLTLSTATGTTTPAISLTGTLGVASGGTNANLTATAGGSVYGTGTALAVTAAGTSGQFLKSNGASAPTWVDAPASASAPYDLRGMFVGNPASSAIIDRFVADRAVIVSTTTTDHRFYCATLPASGTVILTV
jgi:hypothetical protein